jgi:8-oxo-dGTP diphosphatase
MGANEQGANAVNGRWLVIPRTLCFIFNGDDVLLMKRSPQRRVFPNLYNGVGGHIEHDEDPLTSARREILEETGLKIRDIQLRAVYNIDANEATGIVLFVFTGWSEARETIDTHEGTLHWIKRSEVLTLDLVEDLPHLLPRVLAMENGALPLFIHVSYDAQDAIHLQFAEQDT